MVPLVLGVVIFAPIKLFAIAAAALAVGGLREYLDLAQKADLAPMRIPAYIMTALIVALPGFGVSIPLEALFVIVVLTLVMVPARQLTTAASGSASTLFGVLYLGLPFTLLVQLRQFDRDQYHLLTLYPLIMVWIGDTAAYYGGRLLGRHKLAPRVSPGKTWEGTVTSIVVVTAVGYFYMKRELPDLHWALNLFTAITVNIAGQLGDLAESALKRGVGVKDSGTILPGHGGILDRVDALLFAIPVLWYDIKLVTSFYN